MLLSKASLFLLLILLVENTLFIHKTPKRKIETTTHSLQGAKIVDKSDKTQDLMALRTASCSGKRLVLFGKGLELEMPLGRCREMGAVFRTL